MIIQLNPAKWFGAKPTPQELVIVPASKAATPVVLAPNQIAVIEQTSMSAKAVESTMSTAAVVPAPAESGFKRFIDAIGDFFKKSAPVIEEVAVAAEPFLALSPFGPEYDLVVNAIVGVQKTATASLTTGATLTGVQKMALVLQAVTPGLATILASKGVTSAVPAAIGEFAQNVYNLQTGPVATVAPAAKA